MRCFRSSERPSTLAVVFCLVLTAALSASPLLAAVDTFAECDSQCCCCRASAHMSAATAGSATGMKAGCCGPSGSSPCHMSAGSLPAPVAAFIQTPQKFPVNPTTLLPDTAHPAGDARAFKAHHFRIDTDPGFNPPALYLKTCRFIC